MVYNSSEEKIMRLRVNRARALLETVRHVPIATVNSDGLPHNSPVFAAFDGELNMYWVSHPDSLHSQNIARTGQVFAVLFDSMGEGGGLYIQAEAGVVENAKELAEALKAYNQKRKVLLKGEISVEQVTGASPQRLYCAKPLTIWVNMARRDEAGNIIQDERHMVKIEELWA